MTDRHDPAATFELYHPDRRPAADALRTRTLPRGLRSLEDSAENYRPSPQLVDAVNVALAVGAPLLLTGEPGTGKTQLAYHLAKHFRAKLFALHVRSTTTADELLYHFDAVAYLHAAHDKANENADLKQLKRDSITPGALWQAFEHDGDSVVLIDEIDKASRDFPNDLLNAIDQHEFHVPEIDHKVVLGDRPPPVVVITSNSERRLPEPFLRRCIVHHIAFTPDLVHRAVEAHERDFLDLPAELRETAIRRFLELRRANLRKKPATAELLAWLAILAARGVTAADIDRPLLGDLPALSALIKLADDLAALPRAEL